MSQLTASRYRDLCALVGEALDHPRPQLAEVGALVKWPVAIYVLGHRHPASGVFLADYVGSAVRLKTDVSARIRSHLDVPAKRQVFTCQVVLPLRPTLDPAEVRRLEGVVARALGVPRWCQRVPGGRGR
ncbi:hypothetical protein [Cellulomonas sp. URHB0016]